MKPCCRMSPDMRQVKERLEQPSQEADLGLQLRQGLLGPEHFQVGQATAHPSGLPV